MTFWESKELAAYKDSAERWEALANRTLETTDRWRRLALQNIGPRIKRKAFWFRSSRSMHRRWYQRDE